MKIGYKATDENMICRDQQYEIGKEYFVNKDRKVLEYNNQMIPPNVVENDNIGMCTGKVIHYCETLEDCFRWYSPDSSRYFKVEIRGEWYSKGDKSCTRRLKFLEEISKEEIDDTLKQQEIKQEDSRLNLDKLRALQVNFPNLIIGGSLALYLQGAKLKRLSGGAGDFDLIHPFWVDLTEISGVNHIDAKNSGNTFDETFTFGGVKLDLAIDPSCKYKVIEYHGHKYKVNTVENVLKYKAQYATQKNGEKHRDDIYELLGVGSGNNNNEF